LIEKQPFPRRKVCGACIGASNLPLLAALGIGDAFAKLAGPELRQVALYCGDRVVHAPLPPVLDARHPWGRALGREAFDLLLLERARAVGVNLWQPWSMRTFERSAGVFRCGIEARPAPELTELRAPVLIMANGSWEGDPGRNRRVSKRSGDLFAFKANFTDSQLAPGVLPVFSFAGGYGGLVIAENCQLTLAGCIRRDALKACRAAAPGHTAGEAFERHLRTGTRGLRDALTGARREGTWLGIGPIQPLEARNIGRELENFLVVDVFQHAAHYIMAGPRYSRRGTGLCGDWSPCYVRRRCPSSIAVADEAYPQISMA